jgi:hypothetical protein
MDYYVGGNILENVSQVFSFLRFSVTIDSNYSSVPNNRETDTRTWKSENRFITSEVNGHKRSFEFGCEIQDK